MIRLATFVLATTVATLCIVPFGKGALAAQLSIRELAEAFRSERAEPIRVLTITATHGYRHAPAIATTKTLLTALNETTEFTFDITEDLDDLNQNNLEQYDLLFFANSTLRVDEPTDDAVGFEAEVVFQPGDWLNFDAILKTPQRDLKGRIALSGEPGAFSGMAEFGTGASTFDEVTYRGDQLRLAWTTGGGSGAVTAELTLSDGAISGHLKVGDQSFPIEGVVASGQQQEKSTVRGLVTAEHRAAIIDFISGGKGIVGAHSALDALYGWGEYRRMVGGGLFEAHPWTQQVRILIEDPDNPAVAHLGDELVIRDEIYVLDQNPRRTSHVLASLDTTSVGITPDGSRNDYPISWMREHKGGRVFMTKLGHFPEVWTNPAFLQHLLQGMRMAAGRIQANFAPQQSVQLINSSRFSAIRLPVTPED